VQAVHRFFDWMMLLLYVAIVFLLVRPGSKGPQLADTVGDTFIGLVNAATGGGGWNSGAR
jgi:hypothetical protein